MLRKWPLALRVAGTETGTGPMCRFRLCLYHAQHRLVYGTHSHGTYIRRITGLDGTEDIQANNTCCTRVPREDYGVCCRKYAAILYVSASFWRHRVMYYFMFAPSGPPCLVEWDCNELTHSGSFWRDVGLGRGKTLVWFKSQHIVLLFEEGESFVTTPGPALGHASGIITAVLHMCHVRIFFVYSEMSMYDTGWHRRQMLSRLCIQYGVSHLRSELPPFPTRRSFLHAPTIFGCVFLFMHILVSFLHLPIPLPRPRSSLCARCIHEFRSSEF